MAQGHWSSQSQTGTKTFRGKASTRSANEILLLQARELLNENATDVLPGAAEGPWGGTRQRSPCLKLA